MIQNLNQIKQNAIKESFKFVVVVYLIFILSSSAINYFDGYLGGDLLGINYQVNALNLFYFTLLYSFGLIVTAAFSLRINNFYINKWFLNVSENIALFFSIGFLTLSAIILIMGGAGTISRDVETNRFSELFLAAFDPISLNLLLIYYVFLTIKERYYILAILFLVYLLLVIRSGLTGYLFFCLPLIIFLLGKNLTKNKIRLILLLMVLFIPLIRFLRWVMLIGIDEFLTVELDYNLLLLVLKGTIDRFSAVPNMIYISDNSMSLLFLLESKYLPFYQGYIGSFVHKIFFEQPVELNTLIMHQVIQNSITNSNSTFPLLSYFSLDLVVGFFVMIYAFLLLFIISRLLCLIYGESYLGKKITSFLLFIVSFLYVFNGWWWAAVGFIQSLLILTALIFIFGKLKRMS